MSPQEYAKRFKEKWSTAYELKSEYLGSAKLVKIHCRACGKEYDKPASEALRYGCVHCSRKRNMDKGRRTQSDPTRLTIAFVKRLADKFGSKYSLIGDYVDARTTTRLKCNECGREFSVRPDDLLHGPRGCDCAFWKAREEAKQRSAERRAKPKPEPVWTEEKFLQKVEAIWGDEFEVLSRFIGISKYITVRHKLCGNVHEKEAGDLIDNHGCRYCSRGSNSAGVRVIARVLNDLGLAHKREVKLEGCELERPLSFDFIVYDDEGQHCLIEFDGEQHFRMTQRFGGQQKLELVQRRDAAKNEFCKRNGIPLLRISYKSVERRGERAYPIVRGEITEFLARKWKQKVL